MYNYINIKLIIKHIIKYVKEEARPYLRKYGLSLLEIIVLPETPYYLIVRLNCNKKLLPLEIDKIETELLKLRSKGIRVVVRPKNHEISNKKAITQINNIWKAYNQNKISVIKTNPFNKEILKLKKKIYFSEKKESLNRHLWEIEINAKTSAISYNFLTKKELTEAKKLITLSEVAAQKKKSLINFLSQDG